MKRILKWGTVLMLLAFWWGPPSGASPLPLPPGTVPTTVPPPTPTGWEAMELAGLHAPYTPSNVATLDVWAQSEGVIQANNPLASSGLHAGATHCIAQCVPVHGIYSPVYAYDSMTDGVTANVNFLYGSNYNAVRAAFRANAGMMAIWRTINASKWCSGCQGGLYPVYLYRAALQSATPTTTTTVPVSSPLP